MAVKKSSPAPKSAHVVAFTAEYEPWDKDDKQKALTCVFLQTETCAVQVHGREGSYAVQVRDGDKRWTLYVGGLEHALKQAGKKAAEFRKKGPA